MQPNILPGQNIRKIFLDLLLYCVNRKVKLKFIDIANKSQIHDIRNSNLPLYYILLNTGFSKILEELFVMQCIFRIQLFVSYLLKMIRDIFPPVLVRDAISFATH